jgi:hypothetical protein
MKDYFGVFRNGIFSDKYRDRLDRFKELPSTPDILSNICESVANEYGFSIISDKPLSVIDEEIESNDSNRNTIDSLRSNLAKSDISDNDSLIKEIDSMIEETKREDLLNKTPKDNIIIESPYESNVNIFNLVKDKLFYLSPLLFVASLKFILLK